jgi:magnesium transporter
VAATVTVRWMEGTELKTGGLDDLDTARAAGCAVWVDVLKPDAESLAVVQKAFSLHPLAIEDCLHCPQRVKLDPYGTAAFLVWSFPRHGNGSLVSTTEMDTFLGDRFVVTSHRDPVKAIEELCADATAALCKGAEWTLHAILDRGVDDLFPVIDHLADRLDAVEDAMLDDPAKHDLQELYRIKRALVELYRTVAGERDVLRGMARRQEFISEEAYLYFQDVGDHLARATDAVDTYRDVASGAMDIYLSAVSNRLNDVMKRLTIVATIFMPLTFISGIYGMNLTSRMWPSPASAWGFPAVMVVMVVIAAGMLVYFKRRNWW